VSPVQKEQIGVWCRELGMGRTINGLRKMAFGVGSVVEGRQPERPASRKGARGNFANDRARDRRKTLTKDARSEKIYKKGCNREEGHWKDR